MNYAFSFGREILAWDALFPISNSSDKKGAVKETLGLITNL